MSDFHSLNRYLQSQSKISVFGKSVHKTWSCNLIAEGLRPDGLTHTTLPTWRVYECAVADLLRSYAIRPKARISYLLVGSSITAKSIVSALLIGRAIASISCVTYLLVRGAITAICRVSNAVIRGLRK